MFLPSYIKLYESGKLEERIKLLNDILACCTLCPRNCKVNRLKGEKGYCKSDSNVTLSSYFAHFGEEKELVGKNGSGTIFFTNCNLGCVYCQNYEISQLGYGKAVSIEELANIMLYLQKSGCHNINLVTPTHYTPQIVHALKYAIEDGLTLPIVYNCSGYESVKTLSLLKGIIDIYMPDFKYGLVECGKKYSNAPDYFEVCKMAIKEMYNQVGNLMVDRLGIAYRGLIVRHLVLPNNLESSKKIIEFIAKEISIDCYVNIMSQYRPLFKSNKFIEIARRITLIEFDEVINYAKSLGLHRGFYNN